MKQLKGRIQSRFDRDQGDRSRCPLRDGLPLFRTPVLPFQQLLQDDVPHEFGTSGKQAVGCEQVRRERLRLCHRQAIERVPVEPGHVRHRVTMHRTHR